MLGCRVCVIETGARSVVGLMRPGTAALPSAVAFSTACRSAAILGRTQPVEVRSSDLLDRNWSYNRLSGETS